jgi:sortase A
LVIALSVGALLGAPTASTATAPVGFRLGTLSIGKLGLTTNILQGTAADVLSQGVGHYRISSLPGNDKTVAIAGHRTTYHRPFRDLDRLAAGDRILITMWHGKRFVYEVTGSRVVRFDAWDIVANKGYERLVLTTCHPPGSATSRLVVFARPVR